MNWCQENCSLKYPQVLCFVFCLLVSHVVLSVNESDLIQRTILFDEAFYFFIKKKKKNTINEGNIHTVFSNNETLSGQLLPLWKDTLAETRFRHEVCSIVIERGSERMCFVCVFSELLQYGHAREVQVQRTLSFFVTSWSYGS